MLELCIPYWNRTRPLPRLLTNVIMIYDSWIINQYVIIGETLIFPYDNEAIFLRLREALMASSGSEIHYVYIQHYLFITKDIESCLTWHHYVPRVYIPDIFLYHKKKSKHCRRGGGGELWMHMSVNMTDIGARRGCMHAVCWICIATLVCGSASLNGTAPRTVAEGGWDWKWLR